LAAKSAPMPSATDRVLHYSLPDQVLEFAVGEDARLFGQNAGDDALWEETIDRAAVLGLVLNDGSNQPVALASRLLSTSPDTNLLLRGVLVSDDWLVTIPGEGTFYVHADSNAWPFLKEKLVPVWYLDRPWSGPAEYWPTVGPSAADTANVVGLTGSFRGSKAAPSSLRVTTLDPRATSRLGNELCLNLRNGPQVAAQCPLSRAQTAPALRHSIHGGRPQISSGFARSSSMAVASCPASSSILLCSMPCARLATSFLPAMNSRGLLMASTASSCPARN
jgi:hypothetical protein